MQKRKIGNLEVSAIGMGCMGFTHAYGEGPEEKEAIALVHEAFDLGCNFFDTAQMYSYFKRGIRRKSFKKFTKRPSSNFR